MTRNLSLILMVGVMLAGPVLAGGDVHQAAERFISAKLDCDNMSQLRKEACLRDAEEVYKSVAAASGA